MRNRVVARWLTTPAVGGGRRSGRSFGSGRVRNLDAVQSEENHCEQQRKPLGRLGVGNHRCGRDDFLPGATLWQTTGQLGPRHRWKGGCRRQGRNGGGRQQGLSRLHRSNSMVLYKQGTVPKSYFLLDRTLCAFDVSMLETPLPFSWSQIPETWESVMCQFFFVLVFRQSNATVELCTGRSHHMSITQSLRVWHKFQQGKMRRRI